MSNNVNKCLIIYCVIGMSFQREFRRSSLEWIHSIHGFWIDSYQLRTNTYFNQLGNAQPVNQFLGNTVES